MTDGRLSASGIHQINGGESNQRPARTPWKASGIDDTTLVAHPAHNCGEVEQP